MASDGTRCHCTQAIGGIHMTASEMAGMAAHG